MAEALLVLEEVSAGYGNAVVLDSISLEIAEAESLALLGRNGVGKTTLLLTIMGFTRLLGGTVRWRGEDITRLAPHQRARRGLGWVPQEREVFSTLTVEENLTVTARPGRWDLEAAYDLFPRLAERRQAMGNQLSGGEQQMVAIARALLTNPALLLMDEPLEGLAPIMVEDLARGIHRMISEEGMTIALIEQHADTALALTRRAIVLERGCIVHRSSSRALEQDPALLERLIGLRLAQAQPPHSLRP